ncbi:MAG: MFS transporter [Rubrobacteraceae bacterium]|nr:MFS transporter [Rubrobacteraceae bacterium]
MKQSSGAQAGFARDSATWMTYGLVGFFAFMETVLGPIMPFLRRELDLGYTAASLHFSAFALGAVLLGFFGDRLVGRWGRRAALWGGAFGVAAGALVLVSSPNVAGTVPATFAMGICGALVLVTSQAVLSDRHGEWRSVALTESNVTASACAISAPLLVGASAALGLGWRAALLLPIVALCLLVARFFSLPMDLPPHPADDDVPADDRSLPPTYWALWALVALGVASEWCVGYWGADFLADGTGLTRPAAATSLTVFFAAMLVGRVASSRLARTLPPAVLLAATLFAALLGFPLFWFSPGIIFTLVGLAITGLGIGGVYPLGVSAAIASAPSNTDAAAARLAVGGGGAILVAPFVLGALADRVGIGTAFGIVVPMLLSALALALVAGRRGRRTSN